MNEFFEQVKNEVIGRKEAEISNALSQANQTVIAEEFNKIETEKNARIQAERERFDATVLAITNSAEERKNQYQRSAEQAIRAKISASFDGLIADIQKRIGGEQK